MVNWDEPVEEERIYPKLSKERWNKILDEVRESVVWDRVYRGRAARKLRAAQKEEPPPEPEDG